jgi:type VI secretion system secreted protein Hcp
MRSSCILVALISLVSFCNSARGDIFLNVPGIPGDATQRGFENWIDVTSFNLGETFVPPKSAGGARGVASLMDITLTKPVDRSSPKFASAISKGERFLTVDLDVTKTIGRDQNNQKPYLEYTLHDVILTSFTEVATSGTSATDVRDAISLDATKIDFKFISSSGSISTGTFSGSTTTAPEPSTLILAALGGLGLLACRRRFA